MPPPLDDRNATHKINNKNNNKAERAKKKYPFYFKFILFPWLQTYGYTIQRKQLVLWEFVRVVERVVHI
jgi:hypothetical protein